MGQVRYSFRPADRLREGQAIRRVLDGRAVFHHRTVLFFHQPNGLTHSRLGVVVSKKHGKAVRRNRIKRIFRESFRLFRHLLPKPLDVVMLPRLGAGLPEVEMLREAWDKFAKKIPGDRPPGP